MYCNVNLARDQTMQEAVVSYPGTLAQTVEAKLVGDFSSIHSVL